MVLLINLLIILSILFIAIMLFRCIQRKKQLLQQTNIKTFLGGVIGAGYGEDTARKALETYSKTKDAKYPEIHANETNKCGYKNGVGSLKAGCKYPCENPIYNTKGLNWLYRNGNSSEVKNPIDNKSTCLDFDGFNKSNNIAFEYNGPFHYFSSGINEKGLRDFFNSNLHEEIRKKSIIKQNENKAQDIPSYRFIIIPYIWQKSNNIDNYVKSRLFKLDELKEEIKNKPFTFIAESKLKHSTKINTDSYKIAINDTFNNNNNNLSTSLKEIVTKKLEGDMVVYITIYKELKEVKEVKEANVQNTFLDCVYNPNNKEKNNIPPIELWSRKDFEILFKSATFMNIINNPISDNYNELNKFISSIIIEKTEKYIANLKSNVPQVQQQLKEKADEKNRQSLLVPNPIWQQQYQQQPQYESQPQPQQQYQQQYEQQPQQQYQQQPQQQYQQQQYQQYQQQQYQQYQQRQNRRHHPYLRS